MLRGKNALHTRVATKFGAPAPLGFGAGACGGGEIELEEGDVRRGRTGGGLAFDDALLNAADAAATRPNELRGLSSEAFKILNYERTIITLIALTVF